MYKPIDPQKTSTNSRQINKGNQTTIYHNQIAKTEIKIDIAKQPDFKKHTHVSYRETKLCNHFGGVSAEAGEMSRTRAQWPRGTSCQGQQGARFTWGMALSALGWGRSTLAPVGGLSEAQVRHLCDGMTARPGTSVPTQEVFRVWGPCTWDWKTGAGDSDGSDWVLGNRRWPLEIGTQREEQVCGWMVSSVGGGAVSIRMTSL